ncbi:MAG: fused MFS/spermidine synthase [Candidatus Omnitrophica bacterium]|nr:fused MFS/spermidine synthase [Candidatus Omnitrophota bacterium]
MSCNPFGANFAIAKFGIILSFILGVTSIISQTLLLREFVVVFYGNETTYAFVLGAWLFWIAFGSFAASLLIPPARAVVRLLPEARTVRKIVSLCFSLVFIILPLSLVAVRVIKNFTGLKIGEMASIIHIFGGSFIVVMPLAVVIGMLFTFLCRLPDEDKTSSCEGIGNIYLWESAGAAFGGLIFGLILLHVFTSLQISWLVGLMNGAAAALTLKKRPAILGRWILGVVLILFLLSFGGINRLDQLSRRQQWQGLRVIASVDSMYGNLTLTRTENEYSLFENGLISYSTKDELTSEENVHYALLEHPEPRRALLIGNALGGSLREILKHPVRSVDYVELDPMVIQLSQRFLPSGYLSVLKDKRVNVTYTDGRLFVKTTPKRFDVIIINLPEPHSALLNRYYSLEFFKEASRILNPDGVLSLTVSSSENYLSPEAADFLRSINTTLKNIFPDVKSIPGDTNIFLACKKGGVLTYESQKLMERLRERKISAKFVREYYLPYKLSADRVDYIEKSLKGQGRLNTDLNPVGYYYNLVLWATHFTEISREILKKTEWVQLKYLLWAPLLLFIISFPFCRRGLSCAVTTSIITTGFSEIVFQLIIILSFQVLYGYVYYKLGLIMASFMTGLALGSFLATRLLRDPAPGAGKIFSIYRYTQTGICLYPFLLPLAFLFVQRGAAPGQAVLLETVYSVLPVVAGLIGGLQYPLANFLLSSRRSFHDRQFSRTAGQLYAADTWGAALGAILTGVIFIPILGISGVVVLCGVMNLAVLLMLVISPHPAISLPRE